MLEAHTLPPGEILVIDSTSTDRTREIAADHACVVRVIPREQFDHGGTRNLGPLGTTNEILIFMTQDALPENASFLEELTAPIRCGAAAAAFARQLPRVPELIVRRR